jgi:hypothetical protein
MLPMQQGGAAEQVTYYLEKKNGKQLATWQIEQAGVRYTVAWSANATQSVSTGLTMTRASEAECAREVARKLREKLRDGFVQVKVTRKRRPKARAWRGKPVLEAVAKEAKKFGHAPKKLPKLQRSYEVQGFGFNDYWLLGPDERVALQLIVKEASLDRRLVQRFLSFLEKHLDQVFAVEVVWKARLPKPVGPFTHALVLAPEVAQLAATGLSSSQLFWAFPIHDCEFRGDESIAFAEARTSGRGSIRHSTWDREPHPVLDARLQSSAKKQPAKLQVFDPKATKPEAFVKALLALPQGSFLELQNYRGQLVRVVRGAKLELSIDAAPARAISAAALATKLAAFIRG